MRKVSFALAAGFLMACGGGEAQPNTAANPPTPSTTATTPAPTPTGETVAKPEEKKPSPAEAMQKTMQDYGAALMAGDAKKIASFYTDTAVVKFPGMPDLNGKDGVEKMWTKNFATFSKSKGGASRTFVKNDVAVTEWVWTATHSGDMGPIKATEKPIGVMGVDVMWFTPEGLIKEQHTYMDMGTIMSQIGVSKQKARAIPTVPSGAPQVVVATGNDTETKNVDAANKMMGAFEKKSDTEFLAGAADDIAWDDLTQPDTMKGKDAGKKFFKMMTTAFPDIKVSEQNVWGIGDYVIAEGTMSGTQKGQLFNIPPKNKPVNMHGLDIIQFKDGKIVRGWSYGNSAEMAVQLGLIPAPGSETAAKPADAKKPDTKSAPPAPKK
jgi:steroid delta-isomerase-like uncharacterized protein